MGNQIGRGASRKQSCQEQATEEGQRQDLGAQVCSRHSKEQFQQLQTHHPAVLQSGGAAHKPPQELCP